MKKNNRKEKGKKIYKRFDCILAVEGRYAPHFIGGFLTSDTTPALPPDRQGEVVTDRPKAGRYMNIPYEQIEGDFVLVHKNPGQVIEFSGKLPGEGVLGVYRASGTIKHSQIDKLKATHTVDFVGSIRFRRDQSRRLLERLITGRTKRDLFYGGVIFVRDAKSGEPPEINFQIHRLGNGSGTFKDFSTGKTFAQISPDDMTPGDAVRIGLDATSYSDMKTDDTNIQVPLNPTTGEPMDGVLPNGAISFGVGRHDQVVLVIPSRENGVVKGTKAEMLEAKTGILAGLRQELPPDMLDEVSCEVAQFDPSSGLLLIYLTPDGCKSRTVPWSTLPDDMKP